ncbi:cyanase [Paracoccus alkanivorans]|uniref:Cyanate hydratase n=1 Tax=Paracoccus alkanivorans TaxID=2116655 RepID=A0A3M0MA43_9RHOB|nr:cyanase [Paracoccus alkanivorans]RMC34411.1 cyanase [Paracoccus alkanivorans]
MNKMIINELTRDDLTALILRAKKHAGLSWAEIAERIGMSPVWTHSAATGMNAFPEDKARAFAELLGLPDSTVDLLVESPLKHWDQTVPTDPCIYRLYEIVGVYGPTIKAMINEEFGNGIMSAIDFSMQVEREPNAKGDRVKVTMSGKYLEYANW